MKRSSFITWDQLKVGSLIFVGVLVMGVALYKLGKAVNLFSKRYELQAYLKEAGGLRQGGSVMVAGQLAGTIKEITLLPVDMDTMRNVRLVVSIDEKLQPQVRGDSRARQDPWPPGRQDHRHFTGHAEDRAARGWRYAASIGGSRLRAGPQQGRVGCG
jgi:hypothetical protein